MTAHFRCPHGFYSHGTRGVKCPTCTGAISAPLKQGWPLTIGKVYAGCSRGELDWRCPDCRRFTRRDQVTTQAVGRDADVPPGYRAGRAL